jgi:hypothetical protein
MLLRRGKSRGKKRLLRTLFCTRERERERERERDEALLTPIMGIPGFSAGAPVLVFLRETVTTPIRIHLLCGNLR